MNVFDQGMECFYKSIYNLLLSIVFIRLILQIIPLLMRMNPLIVQIIPQVVHVILVCMPLARNPAWPLN